MDRQFRADLHVHSRHSRATSKSLTPRQLAAWAQVKGLTLLGTGDFTHPGWLAELEEILEEDGSGLLRLRDQACLESEIPWISGFRYGGQTRFMLQAEISSIYKKGGKVRKVHNLVYMPGLEQAKRLNRRLAEIGNLVSDGRPILGLDSRHLLEMVLETDPQAFLVPAHIWTPWFSLFGSKSGFDSLEECFGDLAGEIFALETGLSSDPEMNWHISALDRLRMISNSDAHSGEKLGREANLFSGELEYASVYRALKGEGLGSRFLGTLEFFPEEGKYHLDGHRNCNVVLEPSETRARGGLCPVCGKPLTVGVLSRVMELADRPQAQRPARQPGFTSLIPLAEILSEILGSGTSTKKVRTAYAACVASFGSELGLLQDAPVEELERCQPLLGQAVERMRRGAVIRQPGYDGEFGVIRVFSPRELSQLRKGTFLAGLEPSEQGERAGGEAPVENFGPNGASRTQDTPKPMEFNPSQKKALQAGPGPVLVLAGPGTGKTQTLMGRVRRLLDAGEQPGSILAVTFTRRAAGELRERLAALKPEGGELPRADTLHALAFDRWREAWGESPVLMDEESALRLFAEVNPELSGGRLRRAWQTVSVARERMEQPPAELAEALALYGKQKESWNLVDYTDLIFFMVEQIEAAIYAPPYAHVLVDEVQDLTPLQLRLVTALAPEAGRGFFAIGDPNQSIYAFRGAAPDARAALKAKWPKLAVLALEENYRSCAELVQLAAPLFPDAPKLTPRAPGLAEIRLFAAPTAASELSWIGERVRALIGPSSHSLADASECGELSPGQVAVLVRFRQLAEPVRRVLDRLGIPASVPETEAFWREPRVALILAEACRFLGMASPGPNQLLPEEQDEQTGKIPELPEKILFQGPLALSAYLQESGPFDRFFWKSKAFRELSKQWERNGGWIGLVNWVHLQSDLEMVRGRAESVQIMTLHAAKGLEFEAVFLPCLEDGILPFAGSDFLAGKATQGGQSGTSGMDEAEERRLFYVGLTRARRMLHLSHSSRRDLYGKELRLPVSRFLAHLPDELLCKSRLVANTVSQAEQLSLL
ncbi:hypothetical protein PCS_02867 [Desulfocurvibacter africanus PCS]|uniref:UvrD-like helicase ATP-binding domain-containing protein n=1 Tax=Desulfocurvibacter africanus PCS TaxID=1262666 RepID=M5PQK3_DESAF|nr:UvrD-helicase domain-containing protein [Desulfocurvibacter africanus]EMG36364.1 hypothetical protein PCS_02867 [Desulfocurvibacter africanus PCS]